MEPVVEADHMSLSHSELKSLLWYCPNTGVFVWQNTPRRGWEGKVAGTSVRGYTKILINGVSYSAHRLAFLYMTGEWPTNEVDHIDGNRSNNSWENLRDVSRSTGCRNRSTPAPSGGYRGVSRYGDRWVMQITLSCGKRIREYFMNVEDAVLRRKHLESINGYTERHSYVANHKV